MQTIDGELVPAPERIEETRTSSSTRGASSVAVAATVAIAVLGWFDLGDRSLWYDEAFTVGIVDRPVGDALWRIANWELNQSPYYLLFLAWHRIATGEVFLRSLSVLFAVASVPALYLLGRRLAGAWVGAVAAVLLATHALYVEWSQQLRGYSLVVLLVIVATLLFLRAVEDPAVGRVVAYAVVAALAAYAHFFALLVIAAHGVWLATLRPIPMRLVAMAGAIGAVLVSPLAWYLLTREGDPLNWVAEPTGPLLQETAVDLAGGSDVLVVLYGTLALVGAVSLLRGAVGRRVLVLPVLWVLVPVVVTVASSYTAKPLLVPRFLLVVVPALALVAAAGIRALPRRGVQFAALAALVFASGAELADWYRGSSFEDWRGATATVLAGAEDGDVVVVSPARAVHAVRYYEDRLEGPALDEGQPDVFAPPSAERLWEIVRDPREGGTRGTVDPGLSTWYLEWRDGYFELTGEDTFEGLRLRRYEAR